MAASPSPPLAAALENLRRARAARGREGRGGLAAEGLRLVRRGVRAGWGLRQLLVAEALRDDPALNELAASARTLVFAPDQVLLEESQGRRSGLISAVFEAPPPLALEELTARRPAGLLLALVQVEEPGNVGALVRTALASGVEAVLSAGGVDPFHPKAVRTSLGSIFRIPIVRFEGPSELLGQLQRHGVWTIATLARGGMQLGSAVAAPPVALLVGNEGRGLDEGLARAADARWTIGQSEAADSYSVNAAAAICLHELRRSLTTA